jgi:hypothetical protein
MFFRSTSMPRQKETVSAGLMGAGLLFCFALIGCGDTCFLITGIFPNTTSTTNPPTCNLNGGNGTIIVGINSFRPSTVAPMSPNLQHVFITLRGIEAQPSALASEDSPEWQELMPDLANEPVQIDLISTSASSLGCASRLARKTFVRADVYRQIRLRLVSDQPAAGEPLPQHNECLAPNFNCVIDTSGHVHPLALKNGAHDILITSNVIADGSFNVLPGTETHLMIVFDPYSSIAAPTGDAVQIAPVFYAETASACGSTSSLP